MAWGSRRKDMARFATRIKWRNAVRRELSVDQRLPRLRACWIGNIHLEFRRQRKISRNLFYGDDSGAVKITRRTSPKERPDARSFPCRILLSREEGNRGHDTVPC